MTRIDTTPSILYNTFEYLIDRYFLSLAVIAYLLEPI